MQMNRKTLTGSALAILAVLFVAVVLISNTLLRGARLDLTQGGLYTLSDGTKNILGKLEEPIHLTLYFSDKATADSNRPDVRSLRVYFDRVRETLEEMASRAGDKIELEVIDPLPYSEAEDRAAASGIQGIPLGPSGEKVFLGLVGTNSTDGQASIPFFDPGKEELLEYDVAKLIHDLTTVKKPQIGWLSGLNMSAGFDPATNRAREPWAIYQQISQLFDLKTLDGATLKAIDKDLNLVVVVHPKKLGDDAQYALDQFVLRGGHLIVFVDPQAELDDGGQGGNPMAAMMAEKSSDLPALFKAWGVEYTSGQVVLDRARAIAVSSSPGSPPARNPSLLRFAKADLKGDDVITSNLELIHLATSGSFKLAKDSQAKLVPLLQTSDQAKTVAVESVKFMSDPSTLLNDYQPSGERYILAGRLEGKFKTAFPDRKDEGHLAEAKDNGQILLFADTDLLSDRLWVQVQSFFGQKMMNPFANNGDLVINAVDNLSGSSDLISIRGRGTSHRPFTKVEELKAAADDRFRFKEKELQQQLGDTERKLADLQSGKSKDQAFVLSLEQKKELDNFLKRKVEIRKELREVRRQLDADIEALGSRLKFLNIALVPILLTLGALGYAGWKTKQRAE